MLIGSDFNRRCETILLAAGDECELKPGEKISVADLADKLGLDRVELRHLFQYMVDLKLIRVESIGGPTLYGHISLTKQGMLKIRSIREK